jgi:hypothetical protein
MLSLAVLVVGAALSQAGPIGQLSPRAASLAASPRAPRLAFTASPRVGTSLVTSVV